jgi:hypothetical protein
VHQFRRSWPVALLLISSLALATSAVAADLATLRAPSASASEPIRYLIGDTVLALASAVALAGLLARRSWALSAMLNWMVTLLLVVGWILFVAVAGNGPPLGIRITVWLVCALVSATAVRWVRRLSANEQSDAAA